MRQITKFRSAVKFEGLAINMNYYFFFSFFFFYFAWVFNQVFLNIGVLNWLWVQALLILEYAVVEIFTVPFLGIGEGQNSKPKPHPTTTPG